MENILMRPILFRAWHKERKKMYHEVEVMILPGGGSSVYTIGEGQESCFLPDDTQLIVTQFTGLYDQFGTRIYEGDILEDTLHLRAYGDRSRHWEVIWGEQYVGFLLQYLDDHTWVDWLHLGNVSTYRVVGTIYDGSERRAVHSPILF